MFQPRFKQDDQKQVEVEVDDQGQEQGETEEVDNEEQPTKFNQNKELCGSEEDDQEQAEVEENDQGQEQGEIEEVDNEEQSTEFNQNKESRGSEEDDQEQTEVEVDDEKKSTEFKKNKKSLGFEEDCREQRKKEINLWNITKEGETIFAGLLKRFTGKENINLCEPKKYFDRENEFKEIIKALNHPNAKKGLLKKSNEYQICLILDDKESIEPNTKAPTIFLKIFKKIGSNKCDSIYDYDISYKTKHGEGNLDLTEVELTRDDNKFLEKYFLKLNKKEIREKYIYDKKLIFNIMKKSTPKIDVDGRNMLEILVNKFQNSLSFKEKNDSFMEIGKKILYIAPELLHLSLLHEIIDSTVIGLEFLKLFLRYAGNDKLNSFNGETNYSSLEVICYSTNRLPKDKYEIIKILLKRGANPLRLYETHNPELSVVHMLAKNNHYLNLKLILEHLKRETIKEKNRKNSEDIEEEIKTIGSLIEIESDESEEESMASDWTKDNYLYECLLRGDREEIENEKNGEEEESEESDEENDSENDEEESLKSEPLENATPLHYAARAGHYHIVNLILFFPEIIEIEAVDSQNLTAEGIASDDNIKELLKNKRLEKQELTSENLHWIKSLDFEYHRIDQPPIIIDGETTHKILLSQEIISRPKKDKKPPNYATAGITFVIEDKDKGEILDKFVLINNSNLHVSEIESSDEYAKYLGSLGLTRKEYNINKNQKTAALSSEEIEKLHEENPIRFKQLFNHSEQVIFWELPKKEVIKKIVKDLITTLTRFEEGEYKVVAIILNIYSQRYMCENCQNVAMSKRLSLFKNKIISELRKKCFIIKDKLSFTIVVSSTQPYVIGNPAGDNQKAGKKNGKKNQRKGEEDHKDIAINLSILPDNHIFFKDLVTLKPDHFSFTSRDDKRIHSLKKEVKEYKEKYTLLEQENKKLRQENKKLRDGEPLPNDSYSSFSQDVEKIEKSKTKSEKKEQHSKRSAVPIQNTEKGKYIKEQFNEKEEKTIQIQPISLSTDTLGDSFFKSLMNKKEVKEIKRAVKAESEKPPLKPQLKRKTQASKKDDLTQAINDGPIKKKLKKKQKTSSLQTSEVLFTDVSQDVNKRGLTSSSNRVDTTFSQSLQALGIFNHSKPQRTGTSQNASSRVKQTYRSPPLSSADR